MSVSKARCCRSTEKHDLTVAITCVRMVTSKSMYMPRLQTKKTSSMFLVLIHINKVRIWCRRRANEHERTLLFNGFACSWLALTHDNISSAQVHILLASTSTSQGHQHTQCLKTTSGISINLNSVNEFRNDLSYFLFRVGCDLTQSTLDLQ